MMVESFPVDLLNPGQVFACLGVVEAIETLTGEPTMSHFVVEGASTIGRFELQTDAGGAVANVVAFLRDARVDAVIPAGTVFQKMLSTTKWSVPNVVEEREIFDAPVPRTPATLPARLRDAAGRTLTIASWADGAANGRDNVKFWAGAGGYPGAALAIDAIATLQTISDVPAVVEDPFAFAAPMSSSFRFDWRRDYVPLAVGFSPNRQSSITMTGYPLVELLAAIGLSHARPIRTAKNKKLQYAYGVWLEPMPSILARPALGNVDVGYRRRSFTMQLDWPGQENQARCIISAKEETV